MIHKCDGCGKVMDTYNPNEVIHVMHKPNGDGKPYGTHWYLCTGCEDLLRFKLFVESMKAIQAGKGKIVKIGEV